MVHPKTHLEVPAFDSPDELSTAEKMVAYLQQREERESYEGERAYELLKQLVHAIGQGQYGVELLQAREFINVSEFLKKKKVDID